MSTRSLAGPGVRLDVWLASHEGLSRTAARGLIDRGLVTVNGGLGRAGQRVHTSDRVDVVTLPAPPPEVPAGPLVTLDIVYEDASLAVIDKPEGMVVHPAAGHRDSTLADGLRQRGSMWSLAGGPARPGIVHRLDRDTSGLLVVAKTDAAHRALAAQLADRSLGRTYWALVHGVFAERTGTIDAPIGRDPRHRQRMAVVDGGRTAVTEFTVVERAGELSRLDVHLRTGRTHQIRVHLAYIGHPVVGDPVYGWRGDAGVRLALHARRLRFVHPDDGRERVVESAVPGELQALLDASRSGARDRRLRRHGPGGSRR